MNQQDDYDLRIKHVLDYIDNHYNTHLSLANLSKISGFSPYHFHRIFSAIMGESIHKYICRIKLNKAAYKLKYDKTKSVTEIAYECGYNSSSDFTRVFKNDYHMTPIEFRKGQTHVINKNALDYIRPDRDSLLDKNVVIRTFEDEMAAYIRIKGLTKNFENNAIEIAFNELVEWGKTNQMITPSTKYYGVIIDNPEMVDMTECRYLACITISHEIKNLGAKISVNRLTLAGDYLCYNMRREDPDFVKKFYQICNYLYCRYMVDHDYFPDDRPFIEHYTGDDKGSVWIELCIPIKT